MNATATDDNGTTVRHKVDEYFGPGEALRLMEMVNVLWGAANTHMRERATNGPYTFEPYEFDQVLGIETIPDQNSRTRVWYTRRARATPWAPGTPPPR